MWVVLVFGVIGWLMKKTGFEPGPLVLAFVLGQIMETAFRQSMLLSGGSLDIFVTRPLSGGLLAVMAAVVVISVVMARRRRAVFRQVDPDEEAGPDTEPAPGHETRRTPADVDTDVPSAPGDR
jgi:putative tricarboxylic transport membrane protein